MNEQTNKQTKNTQHIFVIHCMDTERYTCLISC